MKTCTLCGESKPLSQFHRKNRNGPDKRSARCRDCANPIAAERMAEYRAAMGPEENKRRVARSRWRHNTRLVQVRTEDDLRVALKDPYPFYAEPRR